MVVVRWALAATLSVAVAGGVARADAPAPIPPVMPGGVADANGLIAVVAQDDGVAAVDLATGQTRWRSPRGRWPLASTVPWIAVGAPDDKDARVLRVRFLRPADGTLLVEARPIQLPGPIGKSAGGEGEGLSVGTGNGTTELFAWVPAPRRAPSRDRRVGFLRVRWKAQSVSGGGGMRPPDRGPLVLGLALVDPATGAVTVGPDDPAQVPVTAPPALPPSWKATRAAMYWSWSWYGAAWTDKPRAFWIDDGLAGFFQYETGTRRLVLNRWRPLETPAAVEVAAGGEWAPQVSMDGRYLILSTGNAGVETFTLHDLLRSGKAAAPIRLPHLEPRFRSPFSVVGPSLFYVTEGEGAGALGGGTTFPRRLVCVDWAGGKIRWTRPLPARFLPPPMAAGGLPR